MPMLCAVCGQGPPHGVSIFRTNETGVEGIWACRQHHGGPLEPDLVQLVTDLEETLPDVYPARHDEDARL